MGVSGFARTLQVKDSVSDTMRSAQDTASQEADRVSIVSGWAKQDCCMVWFATALRNSRQQPAAYDAYTSFLAKYRVILGSDAEDGSC